MSKFDRTTKGGRIISGGALQPRGRRDGSNQINDYNIGYIPPPAPPSFPPSFPPNFEPSFPPSFPPSCIEGVECANDSCSICYGVGGCCPTGTKISSCTRYVYANCNQYCVGTPC